MNPEVPVIPPIITAQAVDQALQAASLPAVGHPELSRLAAYGNLLLHWNSRMNLTAIRDTDGVVRRHIVESVAASLALPPGIATLLDYGSGAGLPGIPIAIVRGAIDVTLAESQSKKVAFLREAVRSLELSATIHAGRVEALPPRRLYDAVTLRAVEQMPKAVLQARKHVKVGGYLVLFATEGTENELLAAVQPSSVEKSALPGAGFLLVCST